MNRVHAALLLLAAGLAPCLSAQQTAQVEADCPYRGDYGVGLPGEAAPSLKRFEAVLRRGRKVMVIRTPEGQALTFTFAVRDEPVADCVELNGHTLCEVADLRPQGPDLVIGGIVFRAPVVKRLCRTGWITLSDGVPDSKPLLALRGPAPDGGGRP